MSDTLHDYYEYMIDDMYDGSDLGYQLWLRQTAGGTKEDYKYACEIYREAKRDEILASLN